MNTASVKPPVAIKAIGKICADDLHVHIREATYNRIEAFSAVQTNVEQGSILVGDYLQEEHQNHVIISDYIEANYTEATQSTLTFTHATWNDIHTQLEALYPIKKIVGWQHTHPGFGIFLSRYDLFIHENFFNMPLQVAYVVDPIRKLRGFFQWKNGKVEKLAGFYLYD